MARGNFYIIENRNIFRRAADGAWSVLSFQAPNGNISGMCVGPDERFYIAHANNARFWTQNGSNWSRTNLTRTGDLRGIAVNKSGVLYFVNTNNQVFTNAQNEPLLSVAVPNLGNGENLKGISVKINDGTIAICSNRKVWELALGGTFWVESVIPTGVLAANNRDFSSIFYDHEGNLIVFDTNEAVNFRRKGTTWAEDGTLTTPLQIGSVTPEGVHHASAYDQGAGVRGFQLGSDLVENLKIGSDDVAAVYLGATKIWG
ncbi:MAG: hypothetical protein OXL96_13885 [Candidatus Poribacteria bacterium]|nr:hypothetical protein [Candidatus Poribacteria bacterium]